MDHDLQAMLDAMSKPETRAASCDKHGPFESRKLFGAVWSKCSKCAEEAEAEERKRQAEMAVEGQRRAWEQKIGRAA